MLLDLGAARDNVHDDLTAQNVLGPLLDAVHELEAAARKTRREVDRAAERQTHEERVSRARECAEDNGLTLERFRDNSREGVATWRLVTTELHHRLLPHRFADPAAFHALEHVLRGGDRVTVLPESKGTLTHVEHWLTFHCAYVADPTEPATDATISRK